MAAGTLTDSPVSAVSLLDAVGDDVGDDVSSGVPSGVTSEITSGERVPARGGATAAQVWTCSASLTAEFDGARAALGVTSEELTLGALAGAMARSVGQGTLALDRVDSRGVVRRIVLDCVDHRGVAADETLVAVRRLLDDALVGRAVGGPGAMVRVDVGGVAPTGEDIGRYALLLHADRDDEGAVRLTWRHDPSRLLDSTVADLSDQWPLALVELTSHAGADFSDAAPAGIDSL